MFIFEQKNPVYPQMRNAPTHLVTLEQCGAMRIHTDAALPTTAVSLDTVT